VCAIRLLYARWPSKTLWFRNVRLLNSRDEQLRRDGIEMIAPHRSNRSKPATQDGRRFRRYARRWQRVTPVTVDGDSLVDAMGR
jgi:hypothetical protein